MAKYINGKRWDARETNISFADAEDEATLMHKYGMDVKIKKLANGKYSVWIHNPAWAKPGWKPRKNISSKRRK